MPARVVEALELEQGEVIADIGTGSGYFIPHLSRSVGGDGRVYAVDIQQEMLAFVQRKVVDLNLTNVVTVLSQETDTRLSAGSVDLALMVDVYHELGSPRTLLANIRNVLKSNGKFAIVDFHAHKEATVVGPPLSHRVPEKRLIDQVKQAGFRLVERHTFLPYQYFLVFARAENAPGVDGARSTSGGPPP
jgi:ubiquinone/menaquinone biosynthesis C-methylase UbiE